MKRFFASNSENAAAALTNDHDDDDEESTLSASQDAYSDDGGATANTVIKHPLSSSTMTSHATNAPQHLTHSESVSSLPPHHHNSNNNSQHHQRQLSSSSDVQGVDPNDLRPSRSENNISTNNINQDSSNNTSTGILSSSIINNYYGSHLNLTSNSNLVSINPQDMKMSRVQLNPTLLPGEEIIDKDTLVYEWNGHTAPSRVAWHQGVLFLTNYRIIFKPSTTSTYDDIPHQFQGSDVPLCTIHKLEKVGGKTNSTKDFSYLIEIWTKSFQHIRFAFVPSRGTRGRVFKYIRADLSPFEFFAFKYKLNVNPTPTTSSNSGGITTTNSSSTNPSQISPNETMSSPLSINNNTFVNGWQVYDLVKEFTRQGVFVSTIATNASLAHRQIKTPPSNAKQPHWRICTLNQGYKICDTYPSQFLVPCNLSDEEVKAAAEFRSRGRIPVLSWYDPESQLSLTRSAQPMIGLNITGKITKKHIGDYRTIESIMQASDKPQQRLMIVDLRPRANAEANRVIKGAGYEKNYKNCELRFMNIENIHVVRNSFARLADICHDFGGVELNWYSKVESTLWLEHLRSILMAAHFCVDVFFRERTSILTHCSDGWDRTSQVVCLFQIMVDPYCRTIEGFAVLIEKEWCSFGHQFQKRVGHGSRQTFFTDERGPIFVQFIDCVYQMMRQHPTAFEFNELFLIFLLDNLYSCRFGTFLFDNERERVRNKVFEKTHSIWTYLLNRNIIAEYEGCGTNYLNPFYDPENTTYTIYPDLRHSSIQLWSTYWLRYAKDPAGYEYFGYTPLHTLQIRANEIIADMNRMQEIKLLSESKNEATVQTFQREFKNMWEEIQKLKKKNEELEEKYKHDTEALVDICEKQKEELSLYSRTSSTDQILESIKKKENTPVKEKEEPTTLSNLENRKNSEPGVEQLKKEIEEWKEKVSQLQLELLNTTKPSTTAVNGNNSQQQSEIEKLKSYITHLEETISVLKSTKPSSTNVANTAVLSSPTSSPNNTQQFGTVNKLWRSTQQ
ncbi:hypothetical protein FDP41_001595 [Naegleria fowleri]|uniref:Myotubularin phosphatase domain-containing protein n=1 Tax=Naegleria fowleri TaxID=5763 RepID=A0A6A5BX75_NAEFO|nr:uncharacterized protein FDP41_001595 [Naegleria fowleri]KAF0979252.1 hypothetical protein FDP41_001595 [Naegleria fowleri]CAG4710394.1 unnamed protein product [Naegleria fowleri]